MQNYRMQAEGIALGTFTTFSETQKDTFLQFLTQKFPREKRTHLFLQDKFQQIRKFPQKTPRHHLKVILAGILDFLPAPKQCEILCLEAQDMVETFRQKITKKSHFTVDEAFDLYANFLEFLYQLHTYPTLWFEGTCLPTDWREVTETVKFITTTQLRASALHFKKDLQIIANNSERISAKILYEVDFLGIKVNIKSTRYSLDRLFAFDENPIPVVVGKFSEQLKAQIFEALHHTEYQLATQQLQKGLLEHDLQTALEHYQKSNPIFNKIDFSFKLQGGAGAVSMQIRTWASVGKRVLAPVRNFMNYFGGTLNSDEIENRINSSLFILVVFFITFINVILALKIDVISFVKQTYLWLEKYYILKPLVLSALGLGGYRIYTTIRRDLQKINQNQAVQNYIRSNDYEYSVNEKKRALRAFKHSPDVPERIYHECLSYIREAILESWNTFEEQNAPSILLLYERCNYLLKRIFQDNALHLLEEEFGYMQPLKYLIQRRATASFECFVAYIHTINNKNNTTQYYLPFLGIERLAEVHFFDAKKFDTKAQAIRSKLAENLAYPLIEDHKLRIFVEKKLEEMQQDTLLEELAQIQQEEYKHTEKDIFIEGEELIGLIIGH